MHLGSLKRIQKELNKGNARNISMQIEEYEDVPVDTIN
jgi:hypothetical protein